MCFIVTLRGRSMSDQDHSPFAFLGDCHKKSCFTTEILQLQENSGVNSGKQTEEKKTHNCYLLFSIVKNPNQLSLSWLVLINSPGWYSSFRMSCLFSWKGWKWNFPAVPERSWCTSILSVTKADCKRRHRSSASDEFRPCGLWNYN